MSAILDVLNGFLNAIKSIVDFIVSFFEDIVFVVKTLGEFLTNAPALFGFLPASAVAIILVALSVVVIYKVVGRD